MSSYYRMTRHPVTGKMEPAAWWDNYFGRHRYGVRFAGLDRVVPAYEIKPYDIGDFCAPPPDHEQTHSWIKRDDP